MRLTHLGAEMRHMVDYGALPPWGDAVIVDVGSSRGEFVSAFVERLPCFADCIFQCLEPVEGNIEAADYNGASVCVSRVALVGEPRDGVEITVITGPEGKYHQWGNLEGRIPSGDNFDIHTEWVEAVSINDLHDYLEVDHIDYLKVDIEGAEYDVFRAIREKTARRIGQFSVEVHSDKAREMVLRQARRWHYNFIAQYANEIFFMEQDRRVRNNAH